MLIVVRYERTKCDFSRALTHYLARLKPTPISMIDSVTLGLGVAKRGEPLIMNRRDDRAGHLATTDSEEEVRSCAYGRLTRDLLRTNEQARARQHL